MDKRMVEESSKSLVDNSAQFDKSLKELRDFSSQLYNAADYWKTAFLASQDKKLTLETTKEYICQAVVIVVDHLGCISANLECCISNTNSLPETQHKIDSLKQRIRTCQNYSYKLARPRLHWSAEFSRYHRRYISLPLKDTTITNAVSSYPESCTDAKGEEGAPFETMQLQMKGLSPPLITTRDDKNLLPVDDGLSVLPKAKHSTFQFQEARKQKRGLINWKLMQNKDIASLIKRSKRILT